MALQYDIFVELRPGKVCSKTGKGLFLFRSYYPIQGRRRGSRVCDGTMELIRPGGRRQPAAVLDL